MSELIILFFVVLYDVKRRFICTRVNYFIRDCRNIIIDVSSVEKIKLIFSTLMYLSVHLKNNETRRHALALKKIKYNY